MHIYRVVTDNGETCYGTDLADGKITCLEGELFGKLQEKGGRVGVRNVLAPFVPSAIICIGLNYVEHFKETGMKLPEFPVIFMKNPFSVIGPNEDIVLPSSCRNPLQVDYEVELAIVIGKPAKNVSKDDAMQYVAGYTIANDVSARTWQMKAGGHQWIRGKSFDTFCPIGPALVTSDELVNPNALDLQCRLNDEVMQTGNTSDMIFPIERLIEYLSEDTTLMPGTLILTGTPSGVGFIRNPPVFLKPGDRLELYIEKIGTLTNSVI